MNLYWKNRVDTDEGIEFSKHTNYALKLGKYYNPSDPQGVEKNNIAYSPNTTTQNSVQFKAKMENFVQPMHQETKNTGFEIVFDYVIQM